MIRIGIIDEDVTFVNKLYNIIHSVMQSIGQWDSQIFHSCEEVMDAIESGQFQCQLLFMDIMLENGKGMDLVQYICDQKLNTDFIFVTASKEHVYDSYHYQTFAYLLKPVSDYDLSAELKRYFDELSLHSNYLFITSKGKKLRLTLPSILYIESNLRKVIIHTKQGDYESYQKLGELEEQLQEYNFVRCHQSYLVSIPHITGFTNNSLQIQDVTIPISRRHQARLRDILYNKENGAVLNDISNLTLSSRRKNYGALICTHGNYTGSIIQICPEKKILIGRDGKQADIIINHPYISRVHCSLLYHSDTMSYEITDYSSNGTFVHEGIRLVNDEPYLLKSGSELYFGTKDNVYTLA